MSNLINEIVLRLLKAGVALLVGLVLYSVITGPMGHPGSIELALLCWISGAAFILLVETGMF